MSTYSLTAVPSGIVSVPSSVTPVVDPLTGIKKAVIPVKALTSGKATITIIDKKGNRSTVIVDVTLQTELFVANSPGVAPALTIYRANANGDVPPIGTIPGYSLDVKFDSRDNLFVTGFGLHPWGDVFVYRKGADGSYARVHQIGGDATGLFVPYGLAVDSRDNLFVSSSYSSPFKPDGTISLYAAGTYGNVPPNGRIGGTLTKLDFPHGIALDSHGYIYVANAGAHGVSPLSHPSITVYAPNHFGNVAPARVLSGALTKLGQPWSLTIDNSTDELYVVGRNSSGGYVAVFAPGASGNLAPIRIIEGPRTLLDIGGVNGVTLDAAGEIYVSVGVIRTTSYSAVVVYPPRASGDVAPIRVISGPRTGQNEAQGLTLH